MSVEIHDDKGLPQDDGISNSLLESFVQLVSPEPFFDIDAFADHVTDVEPRTIDRLERVPESPDDFLAESFPLRSPELFEALAPRVQEYIEHIRGDVTRSSGIGSEGEMIEERAVSFRYGADRFSLEGEPIVWVECICLDSGGCLLPDLGVHELAESRLLGGEEEEVPPELFLDGPARLVLSFDGDEWGPTSVTPWVSNDCAEEAEAHLVMALRQGGLGGASFLFSQYQRALIANAIADGDLDSDASFLEKKGFLAAMGGAEVLSFSIGTEGERTYSLGYRDTNEDLDDAPDAYTEIHHLTLREEAPWGLRVVDVRSQWRP